MTVTLDLPPEVEVRVQAEAGKQEVRIEEDLPRLAAAGMVADTAADHHMRSPALLESVRDIVDENEQSETFTDLRKAVDQDRLSNRKCFS